MMARKGFYVMFEKLTPVTDKQYALAVLIYTKNYKPMADIAVGTGGRPDKVVTIPWDYGEARNQFYFNAYTLFCDRRMNGDAIDDFNYYVENGVTPLRGVIE